MGKRAVSVGARMDGTVDVDIGPEDGDEGGSWNLSHLELHEAEFLHEELGRVIARQRERGFPRPEAKVLTLPAPAPVSPPDSAS